MGGTKVGKKVMKYDPLSNQLFGNTQTGESESYSSQYPSYSAIFAPLAMQLAKWASTEGTKESPFYSDLSRMYSEVASKSPSKFELPDWLSGTMEGLVTTGLPSGGTPVEDTAFYKSTYPAAKRNILEDIIPAVTEKMGASGGLRSSGYTKAATEAASKAMEQFILAAASEAYGLEEAAKNRQAGAVPTAVGALESEAKLPYDLLAELTSTTGAIEGQKYPNLAAILSLIGMGAGPTGASQAKGWTQEPNMQCCFIMLETNSLTERVRSVRDQLFPPKSYVAKGYRKMAKWLVPMMRKNKLIKKLVKITMTDRIAEYCEKHNPALVPLCSLWCLIWEFYGRLDA